MCAPVRSSDAPKTSNTAPKALEIFADDPNDPASKPENAVQVRRLSPSKITLTYKRNPPPYPMAPPIEARLMANSAEVAMSVRNIVEGLVALKALNDSEGVIGDVLRGVRFESDGTTLYMGVPVSAEQIEALKDH